MTTLSDAIRAYEQELLQKAELLAMSLKGLSAESPARGAALLAEITARLEKAAESATAAAQEKGRPEMAVVPFDDRKRAEFRGPTAVISPLRASAAEDFEDIEDFILAVMTGNPQGMSVQDIVNCLDEANIEMKRKTLVVRLHRMVQAGRLSSLAHGQYAVSEAERSHRRA